MISKLSVAQAKKIEQYREEYIRRGISCERVTPSAAQNYARDLYRLLGREEPLATVVMPSPAAAWLAVCALSKEQVAEQVWQQVGEQVLWQVRQQVRQQVWQQVWQQVGEQVLWRVGQRVEEQVGQHVVEQVGQRVEEQVWRHVVEQVGQQVWQQVWRQVVEQVGQQVWQQVEEQVRQQVDQQVGRQVVEQVEAFVWPYIDGAFSANLFAFYDYFLEVCNIKIDGSLLDKYKVWRDSIDFGPIWTLEKICVISDRPEHINLKDGKLHCDGGPAIKYRDGFSVWALNGVRVQQWVAETPAQQIDGRRALEEKNAEVRREIVRKIGIEKFLRDAGAEVIDSMPERNYELLEIAIQGESYQYLKMVNPSIGCYHVEGVSGCKSVRDACHYRKPKKLRDIEIDDTNGADWYQQGDVCVWPRGAHTVKFWPKVLT